MQIQIDNISRINVKESQDTLCDQVALDLSVYLENFPNKSFAIRFLAKETGLNEKTIKRLLKRENRPTYQTIFKLYSTFLDENDYYSLLEKSPPLITNHLKKFTPTESVTTKKTNEDLLELMKKEPLLAELFVLAGTGPLYKSAVSYRYGQYGVELILKFEEKGYFKELKKDEWVLSSNSPNLDSNTLKFLGEYFVSKFSKPKHGELASEHIISFYAEGLNDKGKRAWINLDTEIFYKKMEIANNPEFKGEIPVFTFSATDTIRMENQNV